MSKHTPGPWKIGKYLNSENSNHGIVIAENPHGEGAEDIASIAWVGGGFHREQEANARLIAAAPELLESLRETLEFAIEANNRLPSPESKEEMESGFGCNSWTVDVFKRARAAIAKATAE